MADSTRSSDPVAAPTVAPTPAVRVRRAIALVAGAVVIEMLVVGGTISFLWTPLVLGLAYLASSLSGGRRGGHWATALVLVGWGAGVVIAGIVKPDGLDASGLYLLGAGLGATVGAVLARAGYAIDAVSLAGTVALAGLLLTLAPRFSFLTDGRSYAVFLVVVAVANLVLAGLGRRRGTADGASAASPA